MSYQDTCIRLIKRRTELIYRFVAIINLTCVFILENVLPNQDVLKGIILVLLHQNYVVVCRPYCVRYYLSVINKVRYYR